jgi:hypothetical protein
MKGHLGLHHSISTTVSLLLSCFMILPNTRLQLRLLLCLVIHLSSSASHMMLAMPRIQATLSVTTQKRYCLTKQSCAVTAAREISSATVQDPMASTRTTTRCRLGHRMLQILSCRCLSRGREARAFIGCQYLVVLRLDEMDRGAGIVSDFRQCIVLLTLRRSYILRL